MGEFVSLAAVNCTAWPQINTTKMKKFNWGHGIALFYGIFALSLITVVIRTTRYDHSLVTEKYYEQDLQYQQHYEKLANSRDLKEPLKVWKDAGAKTVSIRFPDELPKIQGRITFYRPSDSGADVSLPFELDEDRILECDTRKLPPGLWTLKIDWQAGQTPYFEEVIIQI